LQNLFAEISEAQIGNSRKRHGFTIANDVGGTGFHAGSPDLVAAVLLHRRAPPQRRIHHLK
jgi:hypothetical protein